MRRYVTIVIVSLFLLFWAALQFSSKGPEQNRFIVKSVAQSPDQPASDPSNFEANAGEQSSPKIALDCSRCHGPGTTLPYLAGELFHKDAHDAYELGHHARALQNGRKAATCLDCHTVGGVTATILPSSDPNSTINRTNIAVTCGKCHGDPSVMQGTGIRYRLLTAYQSSVHANALSRGNTKAAVCTDCHNSHDIRPASDSSSSIFKLNVPKTCGQCHQAEATEFVQSVHGLSIARGNMNSPGCTDCHGIHSIRARADSRQILGATTCEKCHEGVRLTQEFGVAAGRVSSYEDSYHGLAKRFGSDVVADCASCHGVHNILPSSDPKSLIHASNLVQTCGQCHPGASENFTRGKIHLADPASQDIGTVGIRWVRWIYLSLITLTIGAMALHNILVWRRKAAAKLRQERRTILRLTVSQRLQHWLLLASFMVLVISGFALVYPDSVLALMAGSSEWTRRLIHRIAAVVMLAVGAYHLAYLFFIREGRQWLRDIWPEWKDVKDLAQNLRHYVGGKSARAKIGRFGYVEKAEYWAVIWGTAIMGLTGLMIWFKLGIFSFLPRWAIDIAIAVHFYEAVLATFAIVVWHFYHVIFDPDVYPVNLAFYDGRVSEEFYREEHALAYEELKEKEREAEAKREADQAPEQASADEKPQEQQG